jgi:hypothetical protein
VRPAKNTAIGGGGKSSEALDSALAEVYTVGDSLPGKQTVVMSAQPSAKPELPMHDAIRFITHKGKQILLVDCTNFSPEEIVKISRVVPRYVTAQPRGSLLVLADFTGAKFDKRIMEAIKPGLVFDRPYIKRSAWIGTENLPKVFYEDLKVFSQRDLPTFKSREEALDWLVSEE